MNTLDPLDAADKATLAPREYYGEVLIDSWFCALVKGVGKVPYDPTQHKAKFTAIKIDVIPLPDSGTTNPLSRELIAESKEWVNYTLASLKALNVKTAEIRNRWVKVTFVPTGEKYENSSGETKEKTALKFLAVYADEAACQAAFEKEHGLPPATEPAPANGQPDPETRAKLLPFIKVIVQKASEAHPDNATEIGDEVALKIAEHGTLRNYFTATDPDVVQMITDVVSPF